MRKSIQNNKSHDCPVCDGTKKAKVIKNIAQIGKYHLVKKSPKSASSVQKNIQKKFMNQKESHYNND